MNKKKFYKPKVIMSIHGYNSNGSWQNILSESLTELNYTSAPYKYGRKIFRILPHHINNDVKKFRDWYFTIVNDLNNDLKISEPFHRPTIIAHSLGTWILVKALSKYPELKFDKIFLFGSIIPANFDWFQLILRDQVNTVTYEKTDKDRIVPLGLIFTGSLKPCGTKGFIQKCSFINEEIHSLFGHSDFQYKAHLESYLSKRLKAVPHQLMVTSGRELDEKKVRSFFRDTEKIDQIMYPAEYMLNPINTDQAISWFRIEKDIWSFALNSYKQLPIGYINAVPVNDEIYKQFCSSKIQETDITPADLVDYDNCSSYNLLILSIAIKKSVANEDTMITKGRIAEMLIMSFIYKINRHNKGKNKIKKLAAFAWTDEGKKLCEGFCMKKNENHTTGYPLYEIDFSTLKKSDIKNANFMSRWWYEQILKTQ